MRKALDDLRPPLIDGDDVSQERRPLIDGDDVPQERRPLIDGDDVSQERRPLIDGDDVPQEERLCVDEMLRKYCGEFGFWQMRHFVLTCLGWSLEAFHTMVMIFADQQPSWDVSICGGSGQWDGGKERSTVAEWGLVCDQKYKVPLVQALFFAGCITGAGIFGHLSDSKLGRKGSLTTVCSLNAIFGLLTSISPGYWTYVLLRLFTGFSTGGVGLCAFVLATKPIGPTKRAIAGMSTFYFFSGGIALLSGIAYIFQSWRSLYIASSIPSLLFLLFVLPFISESPRWLLIRGKTDQAMTVMHNIAKSNGKHLPKNVYIALDEELVNSMQIARKETVTAGSLIDVIKSPLTRSRLFLVAVINFTCSVVYYGLSLNVVNLKTNLYLNVLLNAIAEIPAYILTAILIDRFGRKPLGVGTQWFSGIFCIVGGLLTSQGMWKMVSMACGVLGIFGMAGTYNLLFVYATELFPTVVRNAALGCAGQMIKLGALLAPLVVVMGGGFPFMVFGACGMVGGILILYLPETMNKPLYDTMNGMADGEKQVLGARLA